LFTSLCDDQKNLYGPSPNTFVLISALLHPLQSMLQQSLCFVHSSVIPHDPPGAVLSQFLTSVLSFFVQKLAKLDEKRSGWMESHVFSMIK